MALKAKLTGARYIESLRDGREVWLDDVTTHPAMIGMVHELARIYDLQHSEQYRDEMTFVRRRWGSGSACRGCCRAAMRT